MTATQEPNPDIKLSGNFQANGASFFPGPSLIDVPRYYKVINVSTAVLDEKGQIKFNWFTSKINIPMAKQVRVEKNVTVLLTIGGEDGNFHFLDGNDKVTNFYNSLVDIYKNWGFDGFAFDTCQLKDTNLPFIVKAIQWFHEDYPGAIISVIALATDVSPAAGGTRGKWNRLVPLINPLKDIINWLQVKAYGYGSAFEELKNTLPPEPQPVSPPSAAGPGNIPTGDNKKMLEYIFTSFVTPFIFNTPMEQEYTGGIYGYYGFDAAKIMLGVLPAGYLGPGYYVGPEDLQQVIKEILDTYQEAVGGVMISSINDDAQNIYDFSRRLTGADNDYL